MKFRNAIVNLFLVFMTFGSVLTIFSGRAFWPFSPYTMYSERLKDRSLSYVALFAVTGSSELPLWGGCNLPRGYYRIRNWLQQAYDRGDFDKISKTMKDCLNKEIASGVSEWKTIRLYKLTWDFDNFDPAKREPLSRFLVLEVSPGA